MKKNKIIIDGIDGVGKTTCLEKLNIKNDHLHHATNNNLLDFRKWIEIITSKDKAFFDRCFVSQYVFNNRKEVVKHYPLKTDDPILSYAQVSTLVSQLSIHNGALFIVYATQSYLPAVFARNQSLLEYEDFKQTNTMFRTVAEELSRLFPNTVYAIELKEGYLNQKYVKNKL